VLDWLITEEDHDRVAISGLATPRDALVTIGETHHITSPRLSVDANFCVVSHDIDISGSRFTQSFAYEGGA
jgi:hypothetical protein